MSRKAILIRVLIFVPLFAYFGYGAVQKWRSENEQERGEAATRAAREAELKAATRTMQLGDGRSIDIVELTPEQAERLHGIKVADEPAPAGDPSAATPPAGDPSAATPPAEAPPGAN